MGRSTRRQHRPLRGVADLDAFRPGLRIVQELRGARCEAPGDPDSVRKLLAWQSHQSADSEGRTKGARRGRRVKAAQQQARCGAGQSATDLDRRRGRDDEIFAARIERLRHGKERGQRSRARVPASRGVGVVELVAVRDTAHEQGGRRRGETRTATSDERALGRAACLHHRGMQHVGERHARADETHADEVERVALHALHDRGRQIAVAHAVHEPGQRFGKARPCVVEWLEGHSDYASRSTACRAAAQVRLRRVARERRPDLSGARSCTMKTTRERRSSHGHVGSGAGWPNTCCTPCTTWGCCSSPMAITPFTRSSFSAGSRRSAPSHSA